MSKSMKVKLVLVAVLVGVGSTNWLSAQLGDATPTLSAASADADRLGIKTYRIHKPISDGEFTTLKVELLDSSQTRLGSYEEKTSADKTNRVQAIEWFKRKISLTFTPGNVLVVADGVEVYSGPIKPAPAAESQAFSARYRDLLELMALVHKDVVAAAREASRLSTEMQRVSALPRALRPVTAAMMRFVPKFEAVAAAGRDEGPECTGPQYCDWGVGGVRTTACNNATQDVHLECWNYLCAGCCEIFNPSCDCACVYDDLLCDCLACGRSCRPGI